MSELITIDEARRRVLDAVTRLGDERVAADRCAGARAGRGRDERRSPCRPSTARPWTVSRCWRDPRRAAIWSARRGRDTLRACGRAGSAVRISTGAVVPEGADAVVPVERTTASEGRRDAIGAVPGHRGRGNIRRAGRTSPWCRRSPRRAPRSAPPSWASRPRSGGPSSAARTGRASPCSSPATSSPRPGAPLAPGGIYSSNGFALAAQVERSGADLVLQSRVPDDPRGHPRRARRGARGRRRGHRLGRRVRRPARSREARPRRARRRGALLGRPAPARQAHLVRHARRDARLRPARQPRVGDGHLPALRQARARRPPGRRPGRPARGRRARASPSRATRGASRRSGSASRQSDNGLPAGPPRAPRARTCSRRCSRRTALALIAAGEGEAAAGERVEVELL